MRERLKQAIFRIAYTKLKHRRDLPCLEKSLVPLLCVGSYVYRCLIFIRHKLYDCHFFSSVRVRVPVISVGNITWGGNGKTPMVEYLAHSFSEAGISPLILTRHWRISRDIDIVMVNALSRFGNKMLLPCGPLREQLNALSRANIIVILHASLVSEEKVMDIRHELEQLRGPLTPIICSEMVPRFFIRVQNTQSDLEHPVSNCLSQLVPLETVKNAVVLCVSGIGCPESLHLTVKHLGAAFIERVDFPDHHQFRAKDLVGVQRKARELHEKSHIHPIIVLTEKDYARNSEAFAGFEGLDLLVLHSTLEIKDSTDVKTFNSLIIRKIQEWCLGAPYK